MRSLMVGAASAILRKLGLTLIADGSGYVLTASWRIRESGVRGHLKALSHSHHLRSLFSDLRVDCVFDVGANRGQFGQFLRQQVGYEGLIVSFEPVIDMFHQLSSVAQNDAKWRTYQFALGSTDEVRSINVMRSDQFSSFLSPVRDAIPAYSNLNLVDHTETVKVNRLADVVAALRSEFGFERAFLKLDTQGYDLEVIAGAGPNLADFVALQSEMSVQPIYQGMPNYRRAIDVLESMGFVISNLFAVSVENQRLVEFDCVMIRNPPFADRRV